MTKVLSLTVFAEHRNATDRLYTARAQIATNAPSLTGFAVLSNVIDRQTDRQNWYANSRPDAARYALASVAKIE